MNLINGGAHAMGGLDFQECMLLPVGFERFSEALRCGAEVFHALGRVLVGAGHTLGVGDEGGFAPRLASNRAAFETLVQGIEEAGYQPGKDVLLGVDLAASALLEGGSYRLRGEDRSLSGRELEGLVAELAQDFPLVSVEDALGESDWEGWRGLTERLGQTLQIVGDDLFVTRSDLLGGGIREGVASSILIKPNQVGTLSETLDTVELGKGAGYAPVVSHRSGETEDTTIADLAVAVGSGQIKTGSASRSERMAKYNRLLRIEEELGSEARFLGAAALSGRLP